MFDEGMLPRRSRVALENAMTVKSKETLEKRVAVFDIGIRCSPSLAVVRRDGRQPNARHYIEHIPSQLLLYLQPSPFPPFAPASSHPHLVIITTSLLFLLVTL